MIRANKHRFVFILCTVAALAILASCATKPKQPSPEPVPEPTVTTPVTPEPTPEQTPSVSQDELDKLMAEAKELKKKAFDLKLFEVLPDDYKASDALFQEAQKAYEGTDATAAKDSLGTAIASYKDLISRGIDELVATKRKEAEDIKAVASKVGADFSQSERFDAADDSYAAAATLVEDSKSEEAITGFETARLYYELAWKRAVASELRTSIVDRDYAKWDSGNYQRADNKFQAEDGFWASGEVADRASGVDLLDEAILRFNLVIQKGREMVVGTVKEKADDARKRSEDIKANVASKDLYDSAVSAYNEGSSQLAAKEYESAADAFDRAGAAFEEAYSAAAEKRVKAEDAMKAADEATAESLRKAEEAEPLVQANSK